MSSIDVNAIDVRADQVPGEVTFHNFEELKQYMKAGLSVYTTTVYTPENLDKAKKDLKDLKAIKKKLADKKKELEAAYSKPIEEVKNQLDELLKMVNEPIGIIDKIIKDKEKSERQEDIMAYARQQAAVLGEYADRVVESSAFFNPRWLNTTCKIKDWKADIDQIVRDAAEAFQTIQSVGGEKKGALLGFYLDKLSLEGAEKFLELASSDVAEDAVAAIEDQDTVVGYKVLKIFGTERQMLQLMSQLDLSGMDYEELEDGMPREMEERTVPDFDSFVAFDIEHTGTFGISNGDAEAEITEIGAAKVVDGQVVDRFDMLANPGRKIVPRIARLTHITDEMVANKPSVDEVIKSFKAFAGNSILVGHNIKGCDIPHITRAAKRAGIRFENAYLDTKPLARKLQEKKGWDKITLTDLSRHYQVLQTQAHRAYCDAEANAYVYLELMKEK